jgi:tRNA pseudouridine55 synthase
VPGQQRTARPDHGDRPAPWESGLVIIDKPGGMTSHDVVARVRRLAHTRRVGHAGTLDPMATGVLVIGIEKATRLLGHLMLTEKTYQATIRLGQSTTTDDAEGEPTGGSPATGVTREALDKEVGLLTGEIRQVPSSVSAIKVNGQRAYKLTRAGEAPELAARPVTIYEFRVTAIRPEGDFLDLDATIRCSSGTYIRALARDLGNSLGTGGHLTALRRTAVGPYTLAHAHTLETLENKSAERPLVSPIPRASSPGLADGAATEAEFAGSPSAAAATGWVAPSAGSIGATHARESPGAPWVTPLAEAAAAAFPRLDLTAADARRLAQGARLPVPEFWPRATQGPNRSVPVAPATSSSGLVAHRDNDDPAVSATRPEREGPAGSLPARGEPLPGTPVAAFAPDGTLVALVTAESGQVRSLTVFVDASAA